MGARVTRMQMHKRKKIEIAVAAAYVDRIGGLFDAHGVKGFTVLDASSGRGSGGDWRDDAITGADRHVVMMAVVKPEVADAVLGALAELFKTYRGIVVVSDVEVMRAERF